MAKSKRSQNVSPKARKALATAYEILVRDVLSDLYRRKEATSKVKHNVFLPAKAKDLAGRSVMRQADVFVELTSDQKSESLVVQAKNWTSPIRLPIVDSLSGMLSSLDGSHRGMLVTPSRYQKGAVLVAKQQGLELCVLRESHSKDFSDGKIPELTGEVVMVGTYSENVQIHVSQEAYLAYENELRIVGSKPPEAVDIFDADGQCIGNFADIHKLIHDQLNSTGSYDYSDEYTTSQPLFLKIHGLLIEILRIRGRFLRKELCRRTFSNKVTHIFGSLFSEEVFLVDRERRVIAPGEEFSAATEWIDMKEHFPHWFDTESPGVV